MRMLTGLRVNDATTDAVGTEGCCGGDDIAVVTGLFPKGNSTEGSWRGLGERGREVERI